MHTYCPTDMEDRPPKKKVSRLQQMQANYQERLMREKEEKLMQIYESNQRQALQRVNQSPARQGVVREFFHQRRIMAANPNHTCILPIEKHFQQMKNGNTFIYRKITPHPHSAGNYSQKYKKNSAGIDRSNLLAPIERKVMPPVHQKPQIVRSRNSRQGTKAGPSSMASTSPNYCGSGSDDTPPPNLSHLKILQNQRIKQHSDLSSYQKWQADQDEEREDRLRNYRENGMTKAKAMTSDEDDVDADIQKKQKELMAQIAAQQTELEELRKIRLKEDEEEKKEMERRRLHKEERRRRMKKEEEEQNRRYLEQEEEERRYTKEDQKYRRVEEEDERQQREDEFQQRLLEKQWRTKNISDTYHQEDDFNTEEYIYKNPTPPLQPKPQFKRAAPIKRTEPQRSATPPSHPTANTEIYDAAIRMEGAYESSNVRLIPCSNCGRKFVADRIEKHELACPNFFKKRKVLDASKLRMAGTEMENYAAKASKQKTRPSKKSNWKVKHDSFIEAIRYAKAVTRVENEGGNIADLPPPPKSDTSDLTSCPHCGRKFNITAAERHIPRCQTLKTRPVAVRRR